MAQTRPWALVTGASAGLGADFARQLAERGWNLVLTARRRDRLEALAEELRQRWGAVSTVIDGDIGDAAFRDHLVDLATSGRQLQCVVNNAGLGWQGGFLTEDLGRWTHLMNINMTALTDLSWRLGRHMRDHGQTSHLINVASAAAFQPVPHFAVYAATKAYVLEFTEAFALEMAGTQLTVTCMCPGGTRTEFADTAGMKLSKIADLSLQPSPPVVREALRAAVRGQSLVVTGWMNKLMVFAVRFLPRRLAGRIAEWGMRPVE